MGGGALSGGVTAGGDPAACRNSHPLRWRVANRPLHAGGVVRFRSSCVAPRFQIGDYDAQRLDRARAAGDRGHIVQQRRQRRAARL